MERVYTLDEVAGILGLPVETVRTREKRKEFPSIRISKGKRSIKAVTQVVLDNLICEKPRDSYQDLYARWLTEQANGYHTGKPLSRRGIDGNEYGMQKFWEYVGTSKSLESIRPERLKIALSNIPVDHQAKKCFYSQRSLIHNAFCSFYKLLVREGLRPPSDLLALKECRPKKVFPSRKTVLQEESLKTLLAVNESWLEGRDPKFDPLLNRTLIMLFAYGGLRRNEAINLLQEHIDLAAGILYVIDGKGHKNRKIGLHPELSAQLQIWLAGRPKSSEPHFLVQKSGKPLTEEVVNHRIQALARKTGIDITPHGLRRTFATLMENRGMPWSLMQLTLGHSDIKTTQGYVLSEERQAIDWLRNPQRPEKQKSEKTASKRAVRRRI